MGKIIVHIDLNAFFATCEELRNPSLASKPLIIGHSGRSGIVSTCNYKAREYGIHSGQPTFQAQRLCPNVVIVPPDFDYYQVMSTSFFCLVKTYCKKIEPASIDECYCDFTEVLAKVEKKGRFLRALQQKIKRELGLSCSIGVGPTRWVAKMASDLKKPMGLTIIRKADIPNILYPLPIESFWGIGRKTSPVLREKGISTIGDLKIALDDEQGEIYKMLGKYASTAKAWVNGSGSDEVYLEQEEAKSIGNSHTLSYDCSELFEIENDLYRLAEEVSRRACHQRKAGKGITLTVKDTEFHQHTKSTILKEPTNDVETIFRIAKELYSLHYEKKLTIRLIGITLTHLINPARREIQLNLFEEMPEGEETKTRRIINEVNQKYGDGIVMRGSEMRKGGNNGRS